MSYKRAFAERTGPFNDVTPAGRRAPSWIAKHASPRLDAQSLRPAPLPREFVGAIQSELNRNAARIEERVAAKRSSMPPSGVASPNGLPALSPQVALDAATSQLDGRLSRESSSPFSTAVLQQQLRVSEESKRAVEQALIDLANARSVINETAANQLAELAATIARRVIAHELSIGPEVVLSLVHEGMRALERQDRLLVRLGKGFADTEDALLERLDAQGVQVEVVVDASLSDYGCVVETEHGWVDESIESRLATLLQELRADPDPR
jgi:hypothetical protein